MSKILFVTQFMSQVTYFSSLLAELQKSFQVEVFADFTAQFPKTKSWKYRTARKIDTHFFYKNMPQSAYFKKRNFSYYPLWLKFVIKSGLVNFLKKWAEKILTTDKPLKYVVEHIQRVKPDVVFGGPLTIWQDHLDGEYIKAAQFLGIPTAGIVHTWDNLTTKARLLPIPDIIFAWNGQHAEELEKYHNVPKEKIKIVGAVPFEHWLKTWIPTPRNQFCAKHGLNPEKDIVLYLGSTHSMVGDETWLIDRVRVGLKSNQQLVVRPHPVHILKIQEAFPTEQIDFADRQLAFDTYHHAAFITGVNTSAMLEAMLCGKAVHPIILDQFNGTQKDSLHFKALLPFLPNGNIKEFLGFGNQKPSTLIANELKCLLNL